MHKGDKLYIEGKIRTRSYDDQNGVKRYVTEIFGDNMEMLTPAGVLHSLLPLHNHRPLRRLPLLLSLRTILRMICRFNLPGGLKLMFNYR